MKEINTKRLKRYLLSHVMIVRSVIVCAVILLFLALGIFVFGLVRNSFIGVGIKAAKDFAFVSSRNVSTTDNRINILLMGIGGMGHDAPDLTDTMILASINTQNKKMSLISVPRDIWINDLKDKINSAYMYGKQKGNVNTGILLAKTTIQQVLGVNVNYGVVIDFTAFKDVIDAIGGVQVDVKNSFTDSQYPIAGRENDNCNGDLTFSCRYMTVSFKAGTQNMNGDTALIFVRSRHSTGIEGTDIAREARQQLVVNAILKKVANPNVFANFSTDQKLITVFNKNVFTDMNLSEEATVARYLISAKSNMNSYTIPDSLLYNPPNQYLYHNAIFTHAFVFIPNNKQSMKGTVEDWSDVHNWVNTVLP